MKTTLYFQRRMKDRPEILAKWVEQTIKTPLKREVQSDGRIRIWSFVVEQNKYLRVVILEDSETVHNAFFDRGFKQTEEND